MGALGESTRSAAIEGMLAEGLTTLLNRAELAPDLVSPIAGPWLPEPSSAPERESSTGVADTDIGPASDSDSDPENGTDVETKPPHIDAAFDTVELLDMELRVLAAELMRRDLSLGELALEVELRPDLGRFLFTHGHRTVDGYYREALGVAPSGMAARIVLAKRVARLPRLKAAIETRRHRLRERDTARPDRYEPDRGGVAGARRCLDDQAISRARRCGRAACQGQWFVDRRPRGADTGTTRGVV